MSSYATLGFPRASGDGPDRGAGISAQCVFPPRERGWSVLATAMEAIAVVSPARAGMVPTLMNALFSERGFPPRERGWSPRPWPRTCGAGVSPARAGMVPGCGLPPPRCHRFPRASGDGPWSVHRQFVRRGFPPRERGWFREDAQDLQRQRVSPARAGMVPITGTVTDAADSFPRASGDGPAPD